MSPKRARQLSGRCAQIFSCILPSGRLAGIQMGAEEYSAPVHAGMAGSGLLSVDPEQPIFGNILPRAAFYGFKGSLRTGQIPRFRQCDRSEEHTSELQSLMRNSYAVFCLKK